MTGLLIVNADDWGGFPGGTDAIERCFEAGAITSASAMVWMSDSRRAAEVALAHSRPMGLHLNLTQPLDDTAAPRAVRERQAAVCAHFANRRLRRWSLDPRPRIHRLVRDAIADQLEAFHTLYDIEPTHFDGHHHVHVSPDVVFALPAGIKLRQTLSGTALHVRLKHAYLAHRFVTTSRFHYFTDLSGPEALEQARNQTVEVMCHPSFEAELPQLLTEEWISAVAQLPHGSYRDLGEVTANG